MGRICCVVALLVALPGAAAHAALEGEWLGSFATARLCGSPASVTNFRLRVTAAPLLHLPAAQFRYNKANVSGPASISVAPADGGTSPPFEISGMFLGGLVDGAPEPVLVGYLVTMADYALWRQRKPFAAPTGALEARLLVHGDWTSRQSLSGSFRSLARCPRPDGPAMRAFSQPGEDDPGGDPRVVLDGVLTRQ